MTMIEIKKEFDRKAAFARENGNDWLADWIMELKETINTIWKCGYTNTFSNDFLREANGYQSVTGNYETLRIVQTLDLRIISVSDKKTARLLAEYILNN